MRKVKFFLLLLILSLAALHFAIQSFSPIQDAQDGYIDASIWEQSRQLSAEAGNEAQTAYYDFLLAHFPSGVASNSWKLEAVDCAFGNGSYNVFPKTEDGNLTDEAVQTLLQSVADSDWKKYYQYLADCILADETLTETGRAEAAALFLKLADETEDPDNYLWRNREVIPEYYNACVALDKLDATDISSDTAQKNNWTSQKEIARCRYENNWNQVILYEDGEWSYPNNFWTKSEQIRWILAAFTAVWVIFLAGDSIAREVSSGTVKFLLLHPVSRAKLFFSKYLALLISAVFCYILLFGLHLGMSAFLFGTNGFYTQYLFYDGSAVQTMPALTLELQHLAYSFLFPFFCMNFTFMLSALCDSPVLSVGISLGFWVGGYFLVYFLAEEGADWGRCLIFSNLDFLQIQEGTSLFAYQTISDGVRILLIHFGLWMLTAYDGFVRREIRN